MERLIHKQVVLPVLTLFLAVLLLLAAAAVGKIRPMALMVVPVVEVAPMEQEPQQVEMGTPHQ